MNFEVFETYEALCGQVAEELRALIEKKPDANICIAAGHSSLGVFDALLKLYDAGKLSFADCAFTAMDEWLGMNETDSGSCGDFLRRNFLSKVDFKEENVSLVDGRAEPIENELERIKDFIKAKNGIDYMVLGVGMNGHLALNEPGVSFDSTVHTTALDPVTQTVGTKYFENAPELRGGVTIGIRDICETKRLALVVNGARKADIVKAIYDSPATESLPATVLKTLPHASIYCDKDAAAKI